MLDQRSPRAAHALIAAALALGAAAHAADEPAAPPVVIEADRAELDDRAGVSVYRGNVEVERGDVTLTADTLTLHRADGGLDRAIAVGEPARFRRAPQPGREPIRGHARRIVYQAREQRIVLEDDAHVQQEGSTFASERIVYELDGDRVLAGGDEGDPSRVHVTIEPEEDPDASEDETGDAP